MSSGTDIAVENSLIRAIKVITGAQINGQKVDQTILGVVRRHLQDNIYEIEYNGGVIKCYAEEGSVYLPQASVYVLVPQGDFSQTKRIVGSATFGYGQKEKALTKVETALNGYSILSDNLLKQIPNKWNNITKLGLNSYKTAIDEITNFQDIKTIYETKWEEKNSEYKNNGYYTIDASKAKIYAENAKGFMLKANFRTKLTNDLILGNTTGDYGLAITLRFKSEDAAYKNMEEKWSALKDSMIYEVYGKEAPERVNLQNLRQAVEKLFNDTLGDNATNTNISVDDFQVTLLSKHNDVESFILNGKKILSDSVLELSQNYSDFLKELSEYQYDENGKDLTIKKLKDIYDRWFTQELDVTYQTIDVSKGYLFGVDSMVGTPYRFNDTWYPQTFIQPVDFENFAGFENIFFYCRGWKNGESGETIPADDNILIKDIELYMIKELDEEDSDYKLELKYPQGAIFSSFSTAEELNVEARLIYQNEHNYTSRCTVEWFKEDPKVTDSSSQGYSSWAGAGWRRLSNTERNLNTSTCHFVAVENQAYENNYMCIAKFGIETILKTNFVLYNSASKRKIEIVSDSGTSYDSSIEEKVLICLIDEKEFNFDDSYSDICFNFNWVRDNEKIVEDEDKGIIVTNNKLTFPSSEVLPNKPVEIKCLVEFAADRSYSEANGWLNENWNPIGEASITLTDQMITSLKGYRIEIENDNQVFQYSESGISPCSLNLEQPLTPKTLTCNFYSAEGNLIPPEKYKVKWVWPTINTMLAIDRGVTDGDTYEQKECPVSITDTYDMNATNNQIACVVSFAGGTYYKETNFYFGKIGENGTNATEVVAKLSPILNSTDEHFYNEPLTLHVRKNNNGETYYTWNNGELNKEVCLGLQLFRNNELIPPNEYKSVKWTIVGNNDLTDSFMTVKHSAIASDKYESCYVTYDDTLENTGFETYCHNFIVKAAAALDIKDAKDNTIQQMYYAYYPIPVIVHHFKDENRPYSLGIDKDKTLRQIMYNNEGRSPQYNKNQGACLDFYNFKNESDNDVRSILWKTIGGIGYNYIETPLGINPKEEGLYEENKDDNGNFGHPNYVPTLDTVIDITNGEYKKYYNRSTEYKIALASSLVEIPAYRIKYEDIDLDEDNLDEIEIWKKNNSGEYNLIKEPLSKDDFYIWKKVVYEKKGTTEEQKEQVLLKNVVKPSQEGWFEKINEKYQKTNKTKIDTTFYKLKNSYDTFKKDQKPKELGWYIKGEDEKYKLPPAEQTIQNNVFYYIKKNEKYVPISPYRLKLFEKDETDNVYTSTIDETFVEGKNYYKRDSFTQIDFNNDWTDFVHPYVQNFYEKKTVTENGKTKYVYVETSDINYDENKKYYVQFANNDIYKKGIWIDNDSKGATYGEEIESQSPAANNWYKCNADGIYILATEDSIPINKTKYYSLSTELDEDVSTLLNFNPNSKNWYINNGSEYILTSDSHAVEGTTYYQLFETVEEAEVTSKFFSIVEGDNSPFLNIKKPEDEEISGDNLIKTRNLTELQLKNKRSQGFDDREKQIKDWADLSASLLELCEKAESSNENISISAEEKAKYEWDKDSVSYEDILTKYSDLQEKTLIKIAETETKIKDFNTEYSGNFINVIPTDNYDGQVNNNLIVADVFRETKVIENNKEKDKTVLEYTVYIPIYLYLNTYGLTALNHWDGNSVEINEDEKYVLAPQVGAGKKNVDDNTFTGVLMGTEKTYNQENGEEERVGILGYNHGKQSIWMDAETGNTILGLPEDDAVDAGNPLTEGRIELRPGGTSRIARWRFDSRSLYRVVSKRQTKYLEGLDEVIYTENNYKNHDDYEQLSHPYEEAPLIKEHKKEVGEDGKPKNKLVDDSPTGTAPAPNKAHGSIPHDQQGILLSAAPTYISIKGAPFGPADEKGISPEGIDYNGANCELEEGDSLEVEINPNSPSIFSIFQHINPKTHYVKTRKSGDYVDSTGTPTKDITKAVRQTDTWYRMKKVGIDSSGRFYANMLKDRNVNLYIGDLGAFGVDKDAHAYTGMALEVGPNDDNLMKMFTDIQENSDTNADANWKTSTMYFSSTEKIDPSNKDSASNNQEGLRSLGFYGDNFFDIYIGRNANRKTPSVSYPISRFSMNKGVDDRGNEGRANIILGVTTSDPKEDGIGSYARINGQIFEEEVFSKIKKSELFLTYENEQKSGNAKNNVGHLYHRNSWQTVILGNYTNYTEGNYKETIAKKVDATGSSTSLGGNYVGSVEGKYTKTVTGLIDYTGRGGISIDITNKPPNLKKENEKYNPGDTWSRLNLDFNGESNPALVIDHRKQEAKAKTEKITDTFYDKLILNEAAVPISTYTHYGVDGKIRMLHRRNDDENNISQGVYGNSGSEGGAVRNSANILLSSFDGSGGIVLWAENQEITNDTLEAGAAHLQLKPTTNGTSFISLIAEDRRTKRTSSADSDSPKEPDTGWYAGAWEISTAKNKSWDPTLNDNKGGWVLTPFQVNYWKIIPGLLTKGLYVDGSVALNKVVQIGSEKVQNTNDSVELPVGIYSEYGIKSEDFLYSKYIFSTDFIKSQKRIGTIGTDNLFNYKAYLDSNGDICSTNVIKATNGIGGDKNVTIEGPTGLVKAISFNGDGTNVTNTSDGDDVSSSLTLTLNSDTDSLSLTGTVPSVSHEDGRPTFTGTSIEESVSLSSYAKKSDTIGSIGVEVSPHNKNGVKVTIFWYDQNGTLIDSDYGTATLDIDSGGSSGEDPNDH